MSRSLECSHSYIKGSPGKGLLYGSNNHTKVVCYSNADWAESPSNKRSTSGYCVSIGSNWFLGRARNKVLWWDLVHKQSIELWLQQQVYLFGLSNCLESYNLERPRKWHLYVTIRQLFISVLILSFRREVNTLRSIVISFEKKNVSGDIKIEFVNSNDQLADIFTKSLKGLRIVCANDDGRWQGRRMVATIGSGLQWRWQTAVVEK